MGSPVHRRIAGDRSCRWTGQGLRVAEGGRTAIGTPSPVSAGRSFAANCQPGSDHTTKRCIGEFMHLPSGNRGTRRSGRPVIAIGLYGFRATYQTRRFADMILRDKLEIFIAGSIILALI